jgi:hypothetical protein
MTAPGGGKAVPLACGADADVCRLDVRLVANTLHLRSSALAEALPFARSGVRVNVFYDRVQKVMDRHYAAASLARAQSGRWAILGHVLAHEIGHVLLGTDRHSPGGLMRAAWDHKYLDRMATAPLLFTPNEVRSIQQRLKTRQAALTGVDRPIHAAKLVPWTSGSPGNIDDQYSKRSLFLTKL